MHIFKNNGWNRRVLVLVLLTLISGFAVLIYGRWTPPHVTELSLKDGVVEIRFNRIPNKELVAASFEMFPAIPGQIRWQSDIMRFTPQHPLPDGKELFIKIGVLADSETAPRREYSGTVNTQAPSLTARSGEQAMIFRGEMTMSLGTATAITSSKDAVLLQRDGRIELYRTSCACYELIQDANKGWQVRDARISADSRYVLLHQTQPATRDGVGQVRLWLYDTQSKQLNAFWEQNIIPDGMWLTPEGSGVIVREAGRMTFLPFEAGKGEITFLGSFDRLLSVTPQGDALLFLNQTDNLQKLFIVQHQKDPQEITVPGVLIEEAELSPDLSTIYMLVRDANTEDDASVRRYVLAHLLFNDVKEVLTQDPLWSATDIALSRDGRQLAVGLIRPSSSTSSALRVLDLSSPEGIIEKTLQTGISAWSDLHWLYDTTQ